MKMRYYLIFVLVIFISFFAGYIFSCLEKSIDHNRLKDKYIYRNHFSEKTGFKGHLNQFNFSYARPVEFYTIGWVRVDKENLAFKNFNVTFHDKPTSAHEVFYFYEDRVICPRRGDHYLNWTLSEGSKDYFFSYDIQLGFLWFVEE